MYGMNHCNMQISAFTMKDPKLRYFMFETIGCHGKHFFFNILEN